MKDYVKVYLSHEVPIITKEKMMTLENLLNNKGFVRVHKSYIVAVFNIKAYNSKELEMTDGRVVPIGKTFKDDFDKRVSGSRTT